MNKNNDSTYKINDRAALDQFLPMKFSYLLNLYLRFKLFFKVISLVNEFNILNIT